MTKRSNDVAFPVNTAAHEFVIADVTSGLANMSRWKSDGQRKANLIVTSPPYFGARDYTEGKSNQLGTHTTSFNSEEQLGHEATPYAYVRRLARTFSQGRTFLHDDGSMFIVIGDTFARKDYSDVDGEYQDIKKGETIGIFGLLIAEMRSFEWRLWQEIVWHKPSVPPSGATQNRCNPCSERILWFVLTKPKFDGTAIREDGKTKAGTIMPPVGGKKYTDGKQKTLVSDGKRCRQDVWTICPSRDKSSHVAPFPAELVEIPVLACTDADDLVVDPFGGTLTTQKVCCRLGRNSLCFDIIDHTKILEPIRQQQVPLEHQ